MGTQQQQTLTSAPPPKCRELRTPPRARLLSSFFPILPRIMMFLSTHNRQTKMHDPSRNAEHSPQPHKYKHPRPQLRSNTQFLLTRDHSLKNHIHDCRRRASSESQQRGDKREGDEMVAVPDGNQDER